MRLFAKELAWFRKRAAKIKNLLKKKDPTMLNALITLFKENTYQEMSTISQIMGAILTTFAKEKFVNGETDRNAAIDALCQLLQSHKNTTTTQ